MSAIVEKFYSPGELVLLLGFTERMWIGKAASGELAGATKLFGEWRIPAGAVNGAIEAGRIKPVEVGEQAEAAGVAARSAGELRRKVGLRRGRSLEGGGE